MQKSLKPKLLTPLKLGEIKPKGWLKNQLKTQEEGLSGHLDEFWPDIMDSGWIGGKTEGWERFPYWLDGIIPLAFLLESKPLIKKCKKYINYILDHQQDDGWFGPIKWGTEPEYDTWPNMVFCKVLIQYFEASAEERIIPALIAYYHKLDEVLEKFTLGESWAYYRWMDSVWGIHWLIDYLHDKKDEISFLLTLAEKLQNQGYDWREHFDDFFYIYFKKDPFAEVIYSNDVISPSDSFGNQSEGRLRKYDHRSHIVNNAMGIKSTTIWSRQSGREQDIRGINTAISILDKYHGQATGIFSGDEHFAGKSPSQGTELCSVVEYMFSLETVIPVIGCNPDGVNLIDRLEKICFNALPATFLPDMWSHQYDQQVNQVQAKRVKKSIYTTNYKDSNIYGLEPNFGCCTANMHQGWPKFVEYGLWANNQEGLVCLAYSPCKLSTIMSINSSELPIEIEEKTFYPFSDTVEFALKLNNTAKFSLKFRIPQWTINPSIQINQDALITCEPGIFFKISRNWEDGDKIKLNLPAEINLERRFNESLTINRGSLIFSHNPKEEHIEMKRWSKVITLRKRAEKDGLSTIPPHVKDWEVYPKSTWKYALLEPVEAKYMEIKKNIENFHSFNNNKPPVKMIVKAIKIENWNLKYEAALPPPIHPEAKDGIIEEITLIPYGCTNIRITEFPTILKD